MLLLPVFYIWHAANSYRLLIPVQYLAEYGCYYLLTGIACWLLMLAILRNRIKAGCWTGFFLLVFFFWGAGHDWLRALGLPPILTSFAFLGSCLVLFFASLLILLFKSRRRYYRLHRFLLIISFVFVGMEAVSSILHVTGINGRTRNIAADAGKDLQPTPNTPGLANKNADSLPDIFVFVFDELTSSAALKKYYGYDASASDSLLRSRGFYVADSTKSNYNSTAHSLASFFNAGYLRPDLTGKPMDGLTTLQAQHTISEGSVVKLLQSSGYSIVNLGLCRLGEVKAPQTDYFDGTAVNILAGQTLWGRIRRQVLWNIVDLKTPLANDRIWNETQQADSIRRIMSRSLDELRKPAIAGAPVFMWSHLMITHKPYLLDRNGNTRRATASDEADHRLRDSLYVDQVRYCQRFIDSVSAIVTKRTRPTVVVLLGDHGKRDPVPGEVNSMKDFMNFTAVYFPDRDYHSMYPAISPVNIPRVLLNRYLHQNMPVLADSTIRMQVF